MLGNTPSFFLSRREAFSLGKARAGAFLPLVRTPFFSFLSIDIALSDFRAFFRSLELTWSLPFAIDPEGRPLFLGDPPY